MQENPYILVNVTEEQVKTEVRSARSTMQVCQCEKCFFDTCAVVLNQMQCRYVTTEKGELLAKIATMNLESKHEMTYRVAQAIKYVHENPRH